MSCTRGIASCTSLQVQDGREAVLGLASVVAFGAAGFGIANEKRWGYQLGLAMAFAPMSVTLTLDDEIDISRGDVLTVDPPFVGKKFDAEVVWMDERPLDPGRMPAASTLCCARCKGPRDRVRWV